MIDHTRLRTLKQFAEEAPAFSVRYLRGLIAKRHQNGFEQCVVKLGRRVLIDPVAFDTWLEKHKGQARGRSP